MDCYQKEDFKDWVCTCSDCPRKGIYCESIKYHRQRKDFLFVFSLLPKKLTIIQLVILFKIIKVFSFFYNFLA